MHKKRVKQKKVSILIFPRFVKNKNLTRNSNFPPFDNHLTALHPLCKQKTAAHQLCKLNFRALFAPFNPRMTHSLALADGRARISLLFMTLQHVLIRFDMKTGVKPSFIDRLRLNKASIDFRMCLTFAM